MDSTQSAIQAITIRDVQQKLDIVRAVDDADRRVKNMINKLNDLHGLHNKRVLKKTQQLKSLIEIAARARDRMEKAGITETAEELETALRIVSA